MRELNKVTIFFIICQEKSIDESSRTIIGNFYSNRFCKGRKTIIRVESLDKNLFN